jgi:hypothetical protein
MQQLKTINISLRGVSKLDTVIGPALSAFTAEVLFYPLFEATAWKTVTVARIRREIRKR